MTRLERVARAICLIEKGDPDAEEVVAYDRVIGYRSKRETVPVKAWERFVPAARAAIAAYEGDRRRLWKKAL
jgi:hypothetical protein